MTHLRLRQQNDIKLTLTENNVTIRLDSTGSMWDLETETCEHRNETSDSIKDMEFS